MQIRRYIPLLVLTALIAGGATTASAGGTEVTTGRFVTLPGGLDLGLAVHGQAMMLRTPAGPDGRTVVVVQVDGLLPGTTYPTHVHNAPCSSVPPGGGHYQHTIGGAVDAVNEMWPVVTTNNGGSGVGFAAHRHWARPDAMSIVIHNPADTSIRIACLDLS